MTDSKIAFNVRYDGQEYHIETNTREYRNLMELMKDKIYPDGFGECGGQGRCGTCLVYLPSDENHFSVTGIGNEATTLSKMNVHDPNVRLCCQVPVDDALQNLTISILNDY
jgi:ferredoxin, 2Fe-2S